MDLYFSLDIDFLRGANFPYDLVLVEAALLEETLKKVALGCDGGLSYASVLSRVVSNANAFEGSDAKTT